MDTFGCVRNTIRLRSGVYFDLENPTPDMVCISDIAGSLSKICRFGGQVDRWYCVAEHAINCACVAMSDRGCPEFIMAVLMHDATEAYVGDCVKPLKNLLPDYSRIESVVESAISKKFGIDFAKWHDDIQEIDRAVVIAEKRLLFTPDGVTWTGESDVRIVPVTAAFCSPKVAEESFLSVFNTVSELIARGCK